MRSRRKRTGLGAALALAGAPLGAAAAIVLASLGRGRRPLAPVQAELERLQDLTWRLSEREERYRSLVENGLEVVVQRDAEGRITFANDAFAALLGLSRRELVGTARAPVVVEQRLASVRDDGSRLVDEAIETRDGVRWFAFADLPVMGRDGAPETLRAGRDVTERVVAERALEEARQRAEAASGAKSRFLATVSHEFRTPLNGILGMAELLAGTRLDAEQSTYVRAVQTSGEALLSLINEVLDFSRIEAGRLQLAAEPFDPGALVEDVVELLAPRAQAKGLELGASVEPAVPAAVIGDPDRLRQVLINLAGNAIKFTQQGGAGIVLDHDAGDLVLTVSDTGPGIAPETLSSIFEEFQQGEAGAVGHEDGAGLGLAITRRLVQGMHGAIEVASQPGRGATFRVRLPLPTAPGAAARSQRVRPLFGQSVLVVADSRFEAPYLARRIEEAGGHVRLTADEAEARDAVVAGAFDILVVDGGLGRERVADLAASARAAGVGRCVVLLSPSDRRVFGPPAAAGFDAYLVRPVRGRSVIPHLTGAADGDTVASTTAPASGHAVDARATPHVLLAEDNEINALLALKALDKLGATADWARNGLEALSLAQAALAEGARRYDLVLMDVRMPGLDGLEATRRFRLCEAGLANRARTPVVALTANSLEEDEAAARRAGLDGFLTKPIGLDRLAALLGSEAA